MLIGHEKLVADLKRLADSGQLSHGYILFGLPRVGKTTLALSLANYLETGVFAPPAATPPLGDMFCIGLGADKTSIGIDDAHAVRQFLLRTPNRSPVRTAVIENGERLTADAENALLKTTEEPGLRALILLAVDDPEQLLPTLRSRLQRLYVPPVNETVIVHWLMETHGASRAAAARAADRSHGAPGLAWGLLFDERTKAMLADAEALLALTGREQSDRIKELVQQDDFDFKAFLEMLTVALFPDAASPRRRTGLWHQLMELRRSENSYNLNPRLQLLALLQQP